MYSGGQTRGGDLMSEGGEISCQRWGSHVRGGRSQIRSGGASRLRMNCENCDALKHYTVNVNIKYKVEMCYRKIRYNNLAKISLQFENTMNEHITIHKILSDKHH